jgi:hypothetical protein
MQDFLALAVLISFVATVTSFLIAGVVHFAVAEEGGTSVGVRSRGRKPRTGPRGEAAPVRRQVRCCGALPGG